MSNQIKPQTLKGFRDFLPEEIIYRKTLIKKIESVFERFGYDPLETPALEYAQTLLGKYGEEADKLLYLFEDRGKRKVGLRYDQTVPTARVISQYQNIPLPFKRYQIQTVWRAENPQKGRYREFLQCDADIIGDTYPYTADAEILALFWTIFNEIGFKNIRILYNSRKLLKLLLSTSIYQSYAYENLEGDKFLSFVRSLDKLSKIGEDGVGKELLNKGLTSDQINELFKTIRERSSLTYKDVRQYDEALFWSLQMAIEKFNVPEICLKFTPTLSRGLDYYTGLIFEASVPNYESSLGGGGRYDNLIKQFTGKDVSAVGFALGFDRIVEATKILKLISKKNTLTKVMVAIVEDWENVFPISLNTVTKLRSNSINAEIYLYPREKLPKQLKYADKKGIPYVIIIGPDEVKKNVVKLKDMKTGEQKEMKIQEIIQKLKSP